ncbi:MAG TPA: cytochrome c oxidase assembly protein [Polyangiaceae bacterium]|nr:cytochrome c oxidase assembly protein [Polyangiaceae bacterium]
MPLVLFAYHPGATVPLEWTWDPLPLVTLATSALAYGFGLWRTWSHAGVGRGVTRAQACCFGAGLLVLALALISPLDRLSDSLFSAHMSQHELLMVGAAPLMVLGRPLMAYLWVLPQRRRSALGAWLQRPSVRASWQFVSAPLMVLVLHAFVRWIWHLPSLFEAAMRHEALHAVQHVSFFLTAALFWWALIHGRYGKAGYGLGVLFVFATALHTSVLGALISVAPRLLYPIYLSRTQAAGWQPLEDQELAGLIMWVPSGAVLSICGLALFAAWLGEAERRARRAEAAARSSS